MASGINNWVHENNVTEKDRTALERAKKIERKMESKGYRWVKINERLQLFVQCDENGVPTADGQRRIDILKANQGIK